MSNAAFSPAKTTITPHKILQWSGKVWFSVTAFGQISFIIFIVAFYYTSTFAGDYVAWNNKPLIDGYKQGDYVGNGMFAFHVVTAAAMTLSGIIQLIPQVRTSAPSLHRLSGRIFVILACALAIGGLWLVWVRGTQLSLLGAISVSLNGLLILLLAVPTVFYAVRRNIKKHQVWAMRFFLVSSGVWFVRVGMMAWLIIAKGPVGMNATMTGPIDIVITFGSYLIPLAIFEVYHKGKHSSSQTFKKSASILILLATCVTVIGVYGTVFNLWLPRL